MRARPPLFSPIPTQPEPRHRFSDAAWHRPALALFLGLSLGASSALAQPGTTASRGVARPAKPAAAAPAAVGEYKVEPAPAWVEALKLAEVETLPVAPAPIQVLLHDRQVRATAVAQEAVSYQHIVRRLRERSGLELASQWQLEFDPSFQRLVLHELTVWRDGQRQNRLPGLKIQTLQRETQLEKQIYDGRATASIVMEDVRLGDIIELRYSLVGINPVFGSRFVDRDWMSSGKGPAGLVRYRLLTPAGQPAPALRAPPQLYSVRHSQAGGWQTTLVERRNVPYVTGEAGAPASAYLDEQIDFSAFANWPAVASWAEQLFTAALRGPIAPAVREQAAQLRRETPAQTLTAVLDFVQTQVRYFGTEIGPSSHQPASPERVLQQRFGDCKDKVSLMVALLRELGIEATPLLVSTVFTQEVEKLPASPLAFNHAILTVMLDGQLQVLDPTRSQQTGPLAERQSLGLGKGLPARAGAELIALPEARQSERLSVQDTMRFSSLARPPELQTQWLYSGEMAEMVRNFGAGEARAELQKFIVGEYSRMYANARPLGDLVVEEVPGHNQIRLSQRFELPDQLKLTEDRWLRGEFALPGLVQALRLPDQSPRTRSLQLSPAGRYNQVLRIELPHDVFTKPSLQRGEEGDAFTRLRWQVRMEPRWLEITGNLQIEAAPVPASQWQAHRDALMRLWPRLTNHFGLSTVLPAEVPRLTRQIDQLEQEVRQGQRKLHTAEQLRAASRLLVLERQLEGERLPPSARVRLLTQQATQLDHLGRAEEGARSLGQALAIEPDNLETLEAAATNAALRNRPDEAVALASRVLERQPQSHLVRLTRARAHYLAGRYTEARDEARQVAQQADEPLRGYALIWQHLSQRRLGQSSGPVVNIGSATDWPTPLLRLLRGELSEAEARRLAQSAKDKDVQLGQLCELAYYLAELRLIEGDTSRARRLFQEAVDTGVLEFIEHPLAQQALVRLAGR